jgi:hypothetical protein
MQVGDSAILTQRMPEVPGYVLEDTAMLAATDTTTLLLTGDVMTGRGIDQVLAHPASPELYEAWVRPLTITVL